MDTMTQETILYDGDGVTEMERIPLPVTSKNKIIECVLWKKKMFILKPVMLYDKEPIESQMRYVRSRYFVAPDVVTDEATQITFK